MTDIRITKTRRSIEMAMSDLLKKKRLTKLQQQN
jgi:hypothetical protein